MLTFYYICDITWFPVGLATTVYVPQYSLRLPTANANRPSAHFKHLNPPLSPLKDRENAPFWLECSVRCRYLFCHHGGKLGGMNMDTFRAALWKNTTKQNKNHSAVFSGSQHLQLRHTVPTVPEQKYVRTTRVRFYQHQLYLFVFHFQVSVILKPRHNKPISCCWDVLHFKAKASVTCPGVSRIGGFLYETKTETYMLTKRPLVPAVDEDS